MTLQLVTPPAAEPVTLAQAKAYLRAGYDAEDELILQLVRAARERVEAETGRALIARTYREVLDDWAVPGRFAPPGQLRLPMPPLISVGEIVFLDEADAETEWPADQYFVDTDADPGRIAVRGRSTFPRPPRAVAGISITFDAGYGADPEDVPSALRDAVLRLTAEGYARREAIGSSPLPLSVQALLAPWRRVRI